MHPLLSVKNLTKEFAMGKERFKAVDNLSLDLFRGETLGLVGESGSGKSTLARLLLRLEEPTSGSITFDKQNLLTLDPKALRTFRRRMQMIFQDPYASLNPRMSVEEIIGEPLDIHRLAKGQVKKQRIAELLELVGLHPELKSRFSHEFSGGQRQRIGIARALAVEPELIICDEPISALDVSIQAQIVNLFKSLQQKMNLTYLFIGHDLSIVRYISDRVAVMYLGHIVEMASADSLYAEPQHPYTQALLSSIPEIDPQRARQKNLIRVSGEPLVALKERGCPFRARCPYAEAQCHTQKPALKNVGPNHLAACHLLPQFVPFQSSKISSLLKKI